MESPIIYNLFPRLAGHMGQWRRHAERAHQMGFNWIYINPIQYPGFSGSLYAVKDFFALNPLFIPPNADDPIDALRGTIDALHDLGLRVMMDLVVNHTAKDSALVREHPTWFRRDKNGDVVSPSAIDPADARKVTVWGDLAEIDNANSPERQGLWAYWSALVQYYLNLGFDGFRCDAAYKVPSQLWEVLIGVARKRNPEAVFAAETLGCRLAEVRGLQDAGFNFLFNSSKWWNFDAPWCLEQHEDFGQIAPSIAFPESHDTPRLMRETDGLVQVQRMRYAFTAVFSTGQLMPIGYEYGFVNKLDVVRTSPEDWEEPACDLCSFIKEVNQRKLASSVLGAEGHWELVATLDEPTIALRKSGDEKGDTPVTVVINKDWRNSHPCQLPPGLPAEARVVRICREAPPDPIAGRRSLKLDPAEVVLILEGR
jgi:starch synthase (maltosyl-transferring)